MSEYLDEDEYPTDEALDIIAKWDWQNGWKSLMAFIKPIWKYADCGYWVEDDRYYLSTAGWSGNESIINSLKENYIFWNFCWVQSKRGGHYIFEIRDVEVTKEPLPPIHEAMDQLMLLFEKGHENN